MMASKVQRGPRWFSLIASILGASNGIASCSFACSSNAFSSTNRNSACGSTNRRISHGQATRSTLMSFRVIHFIFTSRSPGVCELDDEAVFVVLRRIYRHQAGETLASRVDDIQVAVRAIVPSQANIRARRLRVGGVHLKQGGERQKARE